MYWYRFVGTFFLTESQAIQRWYNMEDIELLRIYASQTYGGIYMMSEEGSHSQISKDNPTELLLFMQLATIAVYKNMVCAGIIDDNKEFEALLRESTQIPLNKQDMNDLLDRKLVSCKGVNLYFEP